MLRFLPKIRSQKRKTWQVLVQYLGGFVVVALFGIIASTRGPADFFERKSHDWFHNIEWFAPTDTEHPADQFVIIYIDDQSHTELGQPYDLTWSRDIHAQLLEKITKQNPKLVFYDIIFDQPSSFPEADARFAKAIEESGVVVLAAGHELNFYEDNAIPVQQFSVPIGDFRRPAASWGIASISFDYEDNSVRRMDQVYSDERFKPAYWQAATAIAPESLENEDDYKERRLMRYIGPPPSIRGVSFYDALQNDPVDFRGKYVFIGVRHSVGTTGAARDAYRSPYNNWYFWLNDNAEVHDAAGDAEGGRGVEREVDKEFPGVEMQAIFTHNALNSAWLDLPSERLHIMIACLVALLLTFLVNPFGPTVSLIASTLTAIVFSVASIIYIEDSGVFFSWLVPVAVQAPTAFIYGNVCNYYFLARKRNQLKKVFASYLSPVMVERITDAEEEPQLGGHEEEITPFFSDVVGYSKFSEVLSPMELTTLMNEYLGAMTDVLQEEGGTLDKYIGDAIVAFFGAPLPMKRHAWRACRTAARMQQVQIELQAKWKDSGKWPDIVTGMQTRIGLNTGKAVVGNMGSAVRFNYSMTGDTVNLAARCESGAKHFGVFTMISETTHDAAVELGEDDLVFRKLNRVSVVGREQPVMLYELMGTKEQANNQDLECRAIYEAALDAYFGRDWATAESKLGDSAKLEAWQPDTHGVKTNPSLVLLDQVRSLKEQPPGKDWDGVLRLDSK